MKSPYKHQLDLLSRIVATYRRQHIGFLFAPGQKWQASLSKQIICLIANDRLKIPHKALAAYFKRDRTTITRGIQKAEGYLKVDTTFKSDIEAIEALFIQQGGRSIKKHFQALKIAS